MYAPIKAEYYKKLHVANMIKVFFTQTVKIPNPTHNTGKTI